MTDLGAGAPAPALAPCLAAACQESSTLRGDGGLPPPLASLAGEVRPELAAVPGAGHVHVQAALGPALWRPGLQTVVLLQHQRQVVVAAELHQAVLGGLAGEAVPQA